MTLAYSIAAIVALVAGLACEVREAARGTFPWSYAFLTGAVVCVICAVLSLVG